jgi:hypothetical protein
LFFAQEGLASFVLGRKAFSAKPGDKVGVVGMGFGMVGNALIPFRLWHLKEDAFAMGTAREFVDFK